MRQPRRPVFALLLALPLAACATDEEPDFDLPLGQTGMEINSAGQGERGLATSFDGSTTQVWAIRHEWSDSTSTEARAAGLAWSASSGLNWEQKYEVWVQGMASTAAASGGRTTFMVTNPQGKSLPIGSLECADVAITLRVLFASWYGLPFYLETIDASGTRLYAGHFGLRTATGRYKNTAEFKRVYNDYSHLSNADAMASWPKDNTLRARSAYSNTDPNDFVFAGAFSGGWFDEMLLNKRVGYFLLNVIPYFGSVNFADDSNMYHATAESLRAGDVLIERWQRTGIGHVLITKSVTNRTDGKKTAQLASGSMPPRQALLETPAASKMYYTNEATGGRGNAWDGNAFVDLGGGIKRWMVPYKDGSYWRKRVMSGDMSKWIPTSEKERRAARPEIFEQLLSTPSPDVLRDELLAIIEQKRAWLREHPASCSARTAREDAFTELYTLMQEKFNLSKAEVDGRYRSLEDYVYAELEYQQAKTCCWNSTTAAMFDIVMDYNETAQETAQACLLPTVFKAVSGRYEVFRQHAVSLGRSGDWKAWTADETCPQQTIPNDLETAHDWTPFCDVPGLGGDEPAGGTDPYEPNDAQATAYALRAGNFPGARIDASDSDWFKFEANPGALVRFTITFDHSQGDLDVLMFHGNDQVDSSTGTGNTETVDVTWTGEKPLYVKVFGYGDATGPYTIDVVTQGGVNLGDPCDDRNETMETALEIPRGVFNGLRICANDVDWFRIPATTGAFTATVEWSAGQGPLQVQMMRSNGSTTGTVTQEARAIRIESTAGLRFLKVSALGGAQASYVLRIE